MNDKDRRLARGRVGPLRARVCKDGVGDLFVVNRPEASDLAGLIVGSGELVSQAAQRKLNRAVVASGQFGESSPRQDIRFHSGSVL